MKPRTLVLFVIVALVSFACRFATPRAAESTPTPVPVPMSMATATSTVALPLTGILEIKMVYSGDWYRETFNYQPDAPNIRHMALALPVEGGLTLTQPGFVFTSLLFTASPEPFQFRPEAQEYLTFLEYLHDAPQGIASIELVPGKYRVAVAFIAAALPPPDDDALLHPGVTGGGASTDFQEVTIMPGETTSLLIELTDTNGWG